MRHLQSRSHENSFDLQPPTRRSLRPRKPASTRTTPNRSSSPNDPLALNRHRRASSSASLCLSDYRFSSLAEPQHDADEDRRIADSPPPRYLYPENVRRALARTAYKPAHVATPDPPRRLNNSTRWPNGVLCGARLIDMLEFFSAFPHPNGWAVALWLEKNFVTPFARVDRRDGLVIPEKLSTNRLRMVYIIYVNEVGSLARVQRLWVPGFEPTYEFQWPPGGISIPNVPLIPVQRKWYADEMYGLHGFPRKKLGRCVWKGQDEQSWEREIWDVTQEESVKGKAEGGQGEDQMDARGDGTGSLQ
ncbi:hypothetical protein ACN47E_007183 [Coniothyrium glycines]